MFDQTKKFDVITWNSMLMGYATNGYGIETMDLFNQMRFSGVSPSDITFIGVLSACDHCGLVEEAQKWFHAMKHEYHIDPDIKHYSCMVDLFARAGCLDEALSLIEQMQACGHQFLEDALLMGIGILERKWLTVLWNLIQRIQLLLSSYQTYLLLPGSGKIQL